MPDAVVHHHHRDRDLRVVDRREAHEPGVVAVRDRSRPGEPVLPATLTPASGDERERRSRRKPLAGGALGGGALHHARRAPPPPRAGPPGATGAGAAPAPRRSTRPGAGGTKRPPLATMAAMSAPCRGDSRTGPKPAAVVASTKGSLGDLRAWRAPPARRRGWAASKRKRSASARSRPGVERRGRPAWRRRRWRSCRGVGEREAAAVAARVVGAGATGWIRWRPPWKQTSSSGSTPRSSSAAPVTILKMLAAGAMGREREPWPPALALRVLGQGQHPAGATARGAPPRPRHPPAGEELLERSCWSGASGELGPPDPGGGDVPRRRRGRRPGAQHRAARPPGARNRLHRRRRGGSARARPRPARRG